MMMGKVRFLVLSLVAIVFLYPIPQRVLAQNTDQVTPLFRCEDIPQLLQTFTWSGTRSTTLQSMMRSIQNESFNSNFEGQIIAELQKKPWRNNSIKELEAEFQVIKGQYKAELISESEARLRMACELSKYLHLDYLQNFDRANIFSSQSTPYAFYSYVRENGLWQNLTRPELDSDPDSDQELSPPNKSIESRPLNEDSFPPTTPSNTPKIDVLTILYWLFLLLIGWIILSVISGYLLKNQRFTQPTTRRIFNILLWPFHLIQPLLIERPPGEKKFFGLNQRAYGHPLSEEQLKLMIDHRIAETEKEQPQSEAKQAKKERIEALEAQLNRLEQDLQKPETPKTDFKEASTDLSALDTLKVKVEQLGQKLDALSAQLNAQQEKIQKQEQDESFAEMEITKFRKILQEELGKYKLDIEAKLLDLSQRDVSPSEDLETEEEEAPITQEESIHSPGLNLEIESPDEEVEKENEQGEEEEEDSNAASDQLELTPLSADELPRQFIYYASSPQQGVFKAERLEQGFIPKQTVYKITVDKADPEKASYTMVTHEPTIRLALNILDSYVLPAMELKGPGDIMEATDIGPVQAGELKKVDKDWHIVKKGVLHFS